MRKSQNRKQNLENQKTESVIDIDRNLSKKFNKLPEHESLFLNILNAI